MSEDPQKIVLRASGVFKKFGRTNVSARRQLAQRLGAVLRGQDASHTKIKSGDFWSLQDINLEVRRGELLGVIGLNGAGKSTLLRVLNGLMMPDLGSVEVFGETGALIELGAGFEASLSGRENVFIKGALMGRSRKEMEESFPEIHAFSEIGDFINSPMSSYSSGMRLRLAFSIASTIRPDLLLLDEIVSVGDFAFKQKCRSRLNEMSDHAGVVFASHSMTDIRSMCTKCIVLRKGQIVFRGSPDAAIDFYTDMQAEIEAKRVAEATPVTQVAVVSSATETGPSKKAAGHQKMLSNCTTLKDTKFGPVALDRNVIARCDHYWSTTTGPTNVLETSKSATFTFSARLNSVVEELEIGVLLWDETGNKVAPITTELQDTDSLKFAQGTLSGTIEIEEFALNPGRYITTFAISSKGVLIYRNVLEEISVVSGLRPVGIVRMPVKWDIQSSP